MNFTVAELANSRGRSTGRSGRATLAYLIIGTLSEAAWNVSTTYSVDDKVKYLNREYVCILEATGKVPPNEPTYWTEVDNDDAALTELGTTAPAGYQGMVRLNRRITPAGELHWYGAANYGVIVANKVDEYLSKVSS